MLKIKLIPVNLHRIQLFKYFKNFFINLKIIIINQSGNITPRRKQSTKPNVFFQRIINRFFSVHNFS